MQIPGIHLPWPVAPTLIPGFWPVLQGTVWSPSPTALSQGVWAIPFPFHWLRKLAEKAAIKGCWCCLRQEVRNEAMSGCSHSLLSSLCVCAVQHRLSQQLLDACISYKAVPGTTTELRLCRGSCCLQDPASLREKGCGGKFTEFY